MLRLLLISAFSVALLAACGGEDDPMPDDGPPTPDLGPPPTPPDNGPLPDAGPPDPEAVSRVRAAVERLRTDNCGCDMAVFETVEICAAFAVNTALQACEDELFPDFLVELGPNLTCVARLREEQADCYDEADCGATAGCDNAFNQDVAACPAISNAAGTAYETALAECTLANSVGEGGMCPDEGEGVGTLGAAVFSGNTLGGGDDSEPPDGCVTAQGGGGSADRSFTWFAPAAGTYTFDTLGSRFDTVIYLETVCGGESLGCNDDVSEEDLRSSVQATLLEGQQAIVIVESFAAQQGGEFVVNINAVDEE